MNKEEVKQLLKDNLEVKTKVCNIAWGSGDLITETFFGGELISRSVKHISMS